jgi:enoyl-CoA hydratase
MNLKNLLLQHREGVATITINRPDKLNALNHETIAELSDTIEQIRSDVTVKVVIITGSGDKAFVAGADITEIHQLNALEAHAFAEKGQELMRAIENLPKPVIAMINGYALGGGMELALACHLRVANEQAKMGLPEIKLGIIPGFGGTQRLVRLVGRTQALGLILSGDPVDAKRAHQLGLVNEVTPSDTLVDTTQALARKLALCAPHAVAGILESVIKGNEIGLEAGLALETARFSMCCASEDMKEGTQAFMEKRAPKFQGS